MLHAFVKCTFGWCGDHYCAHLVCRFLLLHVFCCLCVFTYGFILRELHSPTELACAFLHSLQEACLTLKKSSMYLYWVDHLFTTANMLWRNHKGNQIIFCIDYGIVLINVSASHKNVERNLNQNYRSVPSVHGVMDIPCDFVWSTNKLFHLLKNTLLLTAVCTMHNDGHEKQP